MSIYQRDPRAGAFLGGDRVSGQDIRDQNGEYLDCITKSEKRLLNNQTVIAAQSIANVVKSSLGPLGLDKMLVDNIGVRLSFTSLFVKKSSLTPPKKSRKSQYRTMAQLFSPSSM
jgi:hypothetical protein